jgi:hypothetical protein
MRVVDGLLGHDLDSIFNTRGHRCLDIEDINLKNYILFLGDNVSLGLDKNIEQTFPYMVSKKLNMSYYNLSIFNGGYDSLKFNLLGWMNKFKYQYPKMIVITNEFLNSLLCADSSFNNINVVDYSDENIQELIHRANNSGFFAGRNYLLEQIISAVIPIPIYQVIIPESEILITNDKSINVFVESKNHEEITAKLLEVINYRKKRAAP